MYVYTLDIHPSNEVRETQKQRTLKRNLVTTVTRFARAQAASNLCGSRSGCCFFDHRLALLLELGAIDSLTTRNYILATSSTFYIGEKELFVAIVSENWNHKWTIIDCLRCRCGILRATKVEPWNVNT